MIQEFDAKPKGLLQFQINKDIAYLYKRYLQQLEDLRNQHLFMLQKLEKELPTEYHSLIRASNFLDETEYNYHRKKILDAGNEAKRGLLAQVEQFEISLKE